MEQRPKVFVVAAWVMLLCSGPVSSNESCATKTAEPAACSTRTTSFILATAAKSATTSASPAPARSGHSVSDAALSAQDEAAADEETTAPAVEAPTDQCPDIPTGENFSSAATVKLRGLWRVVAGYARKFSSKPFCPELTFCVDSADPNNVTVSWNKAEPFENFIPGGRMTLRDDGNLVDDDGFHHMEVIKLDRFLALRLWNPNFRRVLILSPVSVLGEKEVEGNVFDFIMSIHAHVHPRDGPAWYICNAAYYSMPSSGDGR